MVFITSTKGTPTRAAWEQIRAHIRTAPINSRQRSVLRSPSDPRPVPLGEQVFGTAMKSVKVFFLCIMRPSSCHASPSPHRRDMGHRHDYPTVDQAESVGVEADVIRENRKNRNRVR